MKSDPVFTAPRVPLILLDRDHCCDRDYATHPHSRNPFSQVKISLIFFNLFALSGHNRNQ